MKMIRLKSKIVFMIPGWPRSAATVSGVDGDDWHLMDRMQFFVRFFVCC